MSDIAEFAEQLEKAAQPITYDAEELRRAIRAGGDPNLIDPERGRIVTGMVVGAWNWARRHGIDVDVWAIQQAYDDMNPKPPTPCSEADWRRMVELVGVGQQRLF